MEGRRGKGSILYSIGDYLYIKKDQRRNNDGSTVLSVQCNTYANLCKGRAILDPKTLRVLKLSVSHSCTRDPDLKCIVQMENEMKTLAETTKDSVKGIFEKVCLKDPAVASKIEWTKIEAAMRSRRAKSKQLWKKAQDG